MRSATSGWPHFWNPIMCAVTGGHWFRDGDRCRLCNATCHSYPHRVSSSGRLVGTALKAGQA